MTKSDRNELIDSFVSEGKGVEEIISTVVEKAGVTDNTVRRDLEKMYPAMLAGANPSPEPRDPETPEDKTPAKNEIAEGKVIALDQSGNSETNKGRLSEYTVPEGGEGIVHVELEKVSSTVVNGNVVKTSRPYVQKFDVRAWNQFRVNATNLGFSYVRVLYAPEGTDATVANPNLPAK